MERVVFDPRLGRFVGLLVGFVAAGEADVARTAVTATTARDIITVIPISVAIIVKPASEPSVFLSLIRMAG